MSMTAEVVQSLGDAQKGRLRALVLPVLSLLGALALYSVLRSVLLLAAQRDALLCLGLDIAALAGAATLSRIRYRELPRLLHPLVWGIGLVVLIQVVFDSAALLYGPAEFTGGRAGLFFGGGAVLALVSGALGLWRPAFLVPLFFHYVCFRHQIGVITGVDISKTDYLSMLDVAEFLVIGGLLMAVATRPALARLWPAGTDTARLRQTACGLIWACAVGAHLGNYFVSGWTKVQAGAGDPFFWLLHNPTQTSILIGLERGDNPLAAWPWLVQASWNAITGSGIALNLFVLGTQLAAPLALARRRSLMVFTLLFDVFHVIVYLTLGAFFFFWIAVNSLIFATVRRMDEKDFTPAMKLAGVLAIGLGHFLFYTSHLGWLDGAKLASPRFVAETRDGRRADIPSVYFGIASYSIAQTAMYIPEGHFPMRLGGNTYNPADWRDAQACGAQVMPRQDTGVSLPAIRKLVLQTDAAMREHPAVKNLNLYYAYPHHMVANPALFGAFNRMRIADIVRYHYVVDSVCLGLSHGHLVRDVRKTSDIPIDAGL